MLNRGYELAIVMPPDGAGMIATRHWWPTDVVLHVQGPILPEPNYQTIRVGPGQHLLDENGGTFINHSCDPSLVFQPKFRRFVAARDLWAGDQLTFDYTVTEDVLDRPFDCSCGSPKCRGRIA